MLSVSGVIRHMGRGALGRGETAYVNAGHHQHRAETEGAFRATCLGFDLAEARHGRGSQGGE